jgi:hypothetical protein
MNFRQHEWWRSRRVAAFFSCLALASLLWFFWLQYVGHGGKDGLVKTNAVAGIASAFFAMLAVLVAIPRKPTVAEQLSTPQQLNEAESLLGREVLAQWREEVVKRGLTDTPHMGVRWSATGRPVMGDLDAIAASVGVTHAGGRTLRLRLQGRVEQVVEAFRRLSVPRVVILGEPGSGKTSLAALLTVGLLDRRVAGEPVPVLLTLSSWDPRAVNLQTWIVRRLTEDYVALGNARAYGNTAARDLVADRRVLPVLDGLDEMPLNTRHAAVTALNSLPSTTPLVITCRTSEYEEAVHAVAALKSAPVIELEPVASEDALAYLATSTTTSKWTSVRGCLADEGPDGPMAAALSTPLMVFLARSLYAASDEDPGELVDRSRFPNRAAIERFLLRKFIPTIYEENLRQAEARKQAEAINNPTSRRERIPTSWKPHHAIWWLSCLAKHLNSEGTEDIYWWRLSRMLPKLHFMHILYSLAIGACIGLFGGALLARLTMQESSTLGYVGIAVGGLIGVLLAILSWADDVADLLADLVVWVMVVAPAVGIYVVSFPHDVSSGVGTVAGWAAGLAAGVIGGMALRDWKGASNSTRQPVYISLRIRGKVKALILKAGVVLISAMGIGFLLALLIAIVAAPPVVLITGGLALALLFAAISSSDIGEFIRTFLGAFAGMALIVLQGWFGAWLRSKILHTPMASRQEIRDTLTQDPDLVMGLLAATAPVALAAVGAVALVSWLLVPVKDPSAASPASTLSGDRTATVIGSIAVGIAVAFAGLLGVALAVGLGLTMPTILPAAVGFLLWGSLIGAMTMTAMTLWSSFLIARVRFTIRRKLPWRLMTFLEDARELGVLRRVGASYQFRHARLQEELSLPTRT